MKNTGICPKCESNDIVRIPGDKRGFGPGNNIAVGYTSVSPVLVTRFMCAACGFIEDWLEQKPEIAKVKDRFGGP